MVRMYIEMLRAALRDRKGVSAMEYAILAAAILGAVSAAVTVLGGDISSLFVALEGIITSATTAATGS